MSRSTSPQYEAAIPSSGYPLHIKREMSKLMTKTLLPNYAGEKYIMQVLEAKLIHCALDNLHRDELQATHLQRLCLFW